MLFLWGCEGISLSGYSAPTEPIVMEDPAKREAAGLVLHVSFNPEFELTLSLANSILSVEPLNASAQALFAELDVVGLGYEAAITKILETAEEMELLKNGAVVRITAAEESYGAWSRVSEAVITKPIEACQQEAGVSFTFDLTPAGEGVDLDGLRKHVEETDEYTWVYYTDRTGMTVASFVTYSDGSYNESYYPTMYETIYYARYVDGGTYYFHKNRQKSTGYTTEPEGLVREFAEYYDSRDNLICSISVDTNGWIQENEYENNRLVHSISRWPDGRSEDSTFRYHPNGAEAGYKTVYEDGDYEEVFYNEDNCQTGFVTQKDGIYTEGKLAENGNPETIFYRDEDGTETVETYENGVICRRETTWLNGDYAIITWNAEGIQQTYTALREGKYTEDVYDQEGILYSTRVIDSDGIDRLWIFEDGYAVSCTITEPDGTTYTEYYDD